MLRNLLLGTFDLETLLKSNLNGGKPTRGHGEQLVTLDQIKKAAIIDATLKKWPAASRGQIGTSINMKLTELRSTRYIFFFFSLQFFCLIFVLVLYFCSCTI